MREQIWSAVSGFSVGGECGGLLGFMCVWGGSWLVLCLFGFSGVSSWGRTSAALQVSVSLTVLTWCAVVAQETSSCRTPSPTASSLTVRYGRSRARYEIFPSCTGCLLAGHAL